MSAMLQHSTWADAASTKNLDTRTQLYIYISSELVIASCRYAQCLLFTHENSCHCLQKKLFVNKLALLIWTPHVPSPT